MTGRRQISSRSRVGPEVARCPSLVHLETHRGTLPGWLLYRYFHALYIRTSLPILVSPFHPALRTLSRVLGCQSSFFRAFSLLLLKRASLCSTRTACTAHVILPSLPLGSVRSRTRTDFLSKPKVDRGSSPLDRIHPGGAGSGVDRSGIEISGKRYLCRHRDD